MLTTEQEARAKWCPFVRVAGDNRLMNTLTDGFVNSNASFHCIASECMAWRSQTISHTKRGFEEALRAYGFCGLAARPDYPEAD
jgi:hypothetical protein